VVDRYFAGTIFNMVSDIILELWNGVF
jgi:hypothetical protein